MVVDVNRNSDYLLTSILLNKRTLEDIRKWSDMNERVLVFHGELLDHMPPMDNGFSPNALPYGNTIFYHPSTTFMDRDKAEKDPDWKQVIPYILIRYQNTYLTYQRTKKGGEDRLHNLFSLGIGGHIKDSDGIGPIDAFLQGMDRELKEELVIDVRPDPRALKGVIYDPSTDVGRVHFGFVYVLESATPNVKSLDPAIGVPSYINVEFIKQQRDNFEAWSKICIDNLIQ